MLPLVPPWVWGQWGLQHMVSLKEQTSNDTKVPAITIVFSDLWNGFSQCWKHISTHLWDSVTIRSQDQCIAAIWNHLAFPKTVLSVIVIHLVWLMKIRWFNLFLSSNWTIVLSPFFSHLCVFFLASSHQHWWGKCLWWTSGKDTPGWTVNELHPLYK